MNSIILETQYFPPISYFSKFEKYETVLLDAHENYQKASYRNRCYIAGANGLLKMSIPLLEGRNNRKAIKEVKIDYGLAWANHHWQSIRSAYGRAPYFIHYGEALEKILKQKFTFLFDLNWQLITTIVDLLDLETELKTTDSFIKKTTENKLVFRDQISPKNRLNSKDKYFQAPIYEQLFEEKNGFIDNLSILDLLFCTGPEALLYLENSVV